MGSMFASDILLLGFSCFIFIILFFRGGGGGGGRGGKDRRYSEILTSEL